MILYLIYCIIDFEGYIYGSIQNYIPGFEPVVDVYVIVTTILRAYIYNSTYSYYAMSD